MKTKISYVCGLLFSLNVYATGRTVGNGGDVIVCKNQTGQVVSTELLDFYEGRILKGLAVDLGPSSLSIEEKLEKALVRLERVSFHRAQRYRDHAKSFFQEMLLLNEGHLADIPDAGNIIIPKGCGIEQIANQSPPLYIDDKRYVIDASLWSQLSNDDRAGLILHEIIYREALELGHENSVAVRLLTSNISSQKIETMTVQDYSQFLKELGFNTTSIQGASINLIPGLPEFFQNGGLKTAHVVDNSSFKWGHETLRLRNQIQFYESGALREIVLKDIQVFPLLGKVRSMAPYRIHFYESGSVEGATFYEQTEFKTSNYDFTLSGAAYFYENGFFRLGNIYSGYVMIQNQAASVHGVLQLYPQGQFKNGLIVKPFNLSIAEDRYTILGPLYLSDNGKVLQASLQTNSYFKIANLPIKFSASWDITFYPHTEKVRQACLAENVILKFCDGRTQRISEHTILEFSEAGCVQQTRDKC